MTIKKIIYGTLLISSFASCNKVLDVEPDFNLDGTTAFNSVEDYDFALTGTYRQFRLADYYGAVDGNSNAFATLPDMLGDNLDERAQESLFNKRVFSSWNYAEDENQIENTWTTAYGIIGQANIIANGVDEFASSDPGAVNRVKAQALTIRAMVHFDLLRYWADNYDRNSTLPGIPYIKVFDYEQKPSRGTVKQTYDNIEADLQAARALMGNMDRAINSGSNTSGTARAYMDINAVNAISARMYLYANKMDSAIKYSTLVINARPLANRTDFPRIWIDGSTAEVVWSCIFDATQGGPGLSVYSPTRNRSEYIPNPTLLTNYNQANDIRYSSYFLSRTASSGTRTVLSKYQAKEAQLPRPDGVTNFKAIRTGEMYLIRAEAYARSSNDVLALADLNTLRSTRILNFVAGTETGAALINAIALERRKELIGEGHRWFDLKRTTHVINRLNCSNFCTLGSTAREWTWPIPQPEIDANPNILPQNPGY